MKKLKIKPYHIFQYKGCHFVFDINSSIVMKIEDPAYDALSLRLQDVSLNKIKKHLITTYDKNTAQSVLQELNLLYDEGLLKGPVWTYNDEETGTLIQKLSKDSSGNITFSIAESCNLNCKYCYLRESYSLNKGLMPKKVAKHAVDFTFDRAGSNKTIKITFFGGEPLLNMPVIKYVVNYATELAAHHDLKVQFSMTTNGTLLDDEKIQYIIKNKIGIMVSIDGPREVHDQMRVYADGQGSFDITMRNIKELMKQGRRMNARCTLTNQCLDQPFIVHGLEELGFRGITITPSWGKSYHRWSYDIGPEETESIHDQDNFFFERLFEQLESGQTVQFNPWFKAVRAIHKRSNPRVPCGFGRGTLTVGIDGKLYPCHRYVGMDNYIIGDVLKGIDREKLVNYYHVYYSTKKKCETCWAIKICSRICPWYVTHEDGTGHPPPDWFCDNLKRWYEQGMWFYDILRERYPAYLSRIVGEARKPVSV